MPLHNDSGYKLLFAHPRMIRELLRDWVPGEWINEPTSPPSNASTAATSPKARSSVTMTWSRLKERWLWGYLVLEFVRHEVAQVIVPTGPPRGGT
jgi:hypothetical protein